MELNDYAEVYGPIPEGGTRAQLLRTVPYTGPAARGFNGWASRLAEDPDVLLVRGYVGGVHVGDWEPRAVAELDDGTIVYTGAAIEGTE